METLGFTEEAFFGFILLMLRFGSLFAFAPAFSLRALPARVKAAVILTLAIIFAYSGVAPPVPVPDNFALMVTVMFKEVLIGLALALVAQLIFAAVELSASVLAGQMGLAIAQTVNPATGGQMTVIGQIYLFAAFLVFFTIGGDRFLIKAFAGNLERLPLGEFTLTGGFMKTLVLLGSEIFSVGFRMAAPVLAVLFCTSVVMGIFARSVPQMNMLILGFPLRIGVGLIMIWLTLPLWMDFLVRALARMYDALHGIPLLIG